MLNRWECFFLLVMTLPIMGHVVILPLLYDVAGRDAWISVFLSLPAAFFLLLAVYRLRVRLPGQHSSHIVLKGLKKPVNYILLAVLALYFGFLSAFSIAALADMIHIAFLPETPMSALILWAVLMCWFATWKGTKIIAQTAGVLTVVALITGHTITLLDTPKKDFASILPILEFGWQPPFWGAFILLSIWIELLFLMLVPLAIHQQKKNYFPVWLIGLFANAIMMLSTMTGTIMIFGMGQADNFTYPALETVRILTLGFIDRFDIYGLILMSFGCYIRGSLYLRIAFDLLLTEHSQRTVTGRSLFVGMGAVIAIAAFLIGKDRFTLDQFTIYYSFSIALYPIPFLLLFFAKKQSNRESSTDAEPEAE